ncbi:MAG: hypothetical protein M3Q07_08460 [Pseudobdellovibrionaceae bacterium]|nr:hypothetical protein [Pseudobdellovibrionaceae bacterium]
MKCLALIMGLLGLGSPLWADCRPVNITEFREATQKSPNRVVFFASWCSSCASHITADRIQDTIFVASADTKPKADKVLQVYLKDRASAATCFFDKDESIAQAFGVRNLPVEKSIRDLRQP